MKKFNWQIWAGFLLVLFSFISYPFIFIDYPILRDFPWLNLILFALALAFVFVGVRRAFQPGRRLVSKIIAPALATLTLLIIVSFLFIAFILARQLPTSAGAPQVGQKAPEFSLVDTNNTPTALGELLAQPVNNKPPKGILLIFYRGYW